MSHVKTNLPKVRVEDIQLQKLLDSLTLVLRTWNGETGDGENRVVTLHDLSDDITTINKLQAASNTITDQTSSYTIAEITEPTLNTWKQVQTASVTTDGLSTLLINNSFILSANQHVATMEVSIMRGATEIYNSVLNNDPLPTSTLKTIPVAISITDTPPAGAYTYVSRIQFTAETNVASEIRGKNRSLIVS